MNEVMKVLVYDLGFEPVEDYYETFMSIKSVTFERYTAPECNSNIHRVILSKLGSNWEIYSLCDDIRFDVATPYPLTVTEIKAFLNFIEEFEKAF